MATLSTRDGGKRIIQFTDADKRRRRLYLGKIPAKAAKTIQSHVEALVHASLTGTSPPPATSGWVGEAGGVLHEKLVKLGLTSPRETSEPTELGAFLDTYIESRTDLKPNTVMHLGHAKDELVEYFGANKLLEEITPGDADDFRRWLAPQMGANSVRRIMGRCKQFFRAAIRKKLISENPFGDMRDTSVQPNRERDFFLTRADAARVMEACPSAEWRLIFCLSRFGGLRCPSEHVALKWRDVDFAAGTIRVRSPKTEHHPGSGSCVIPAFPEFVEPLRGCFELAEPGAEYVITKTRDAGANWRTTMTKIITRAGVQPWPKLFANLRATRATELEEQFPRHVVRTWLGHTEAIAQRHYLQVTSEHFAKATGGSVQALRNALQTVPEMQRIAAPIVNKANQKPPKKQVFSGVCQCTKTPRVGLEPTT